MPRLKESSESFFPPFSSSEKLLSLHPLLFILCVDSRFLPMHFQSVTPTATVWLNCSIMNIVVVAVFVHHELQQTEVDSDSFFTPLGISKMQRRFQLFKRGPIGFPRLFEKIQQPEFFAGAKVKGLNDKNLIYWTR